MAVPRKKILDAPIRNKVLEPSGLFSKVWQEFILRVHSLLTPLGEERSFALTNNQAPSAVISGLSFDKSFVSAAAIDYLIQRVTTGVGATELVECGTFYIGYNPTSLAWSLWNGPSTAGVTLTISAAGEIKYLSTDITGTASISKIVCRARTFTAKNSTYSSFGGGIW